MSDDKNEATIASETTEAILAEENALKEPQQEELINQVVEKYGLDIDTQAELISAIVADKLEERKKFSTVIKQKRTWRDKATMLEKGDKPKAPATADDSLNVESLIEAKLQERLDKRDLDSLEISDELKKEIKDYASLHKTTIGEARKSEYINFLMDKEVRKAKSDDASISSKHNKSYATKNLKDMSPKDFDLSTEEGRKSWADYKKMLKSQS
jgi:hypothetical protein